jgi:hypothetical protein
MSSSKHVELEGMETYDGFTKSVREYQEYILTRKCINIIIECINVMCTNHTHGIHVFVALEEEDQHNCHRKKLKYSKFCPPAFLKSNHL